MLSFSVIHSRICDSILSTTDAYASPGGGLPPSSSLSSLLVFAAPLFHLKFYIIHRTNLGMLSPGTMGTVFMASLFRKGMAATPVAKCFFNP